jgi:AGZA family xanthine/uracil permease-like MFS transporter
MVKIKNALSTFFELEANHTSFKTECLAGITTFFTMSYIIFLTPSILSTTGMDAGAIFMATCLLVAISTLLISLIANAPIAIAPGIPLTAFFAYIVVNTHGYHWQDALGMVFISGILFIILTITRVRRILIESIPSNMNTAIIVGISLLIALIALKNNHIIAVNAKGFIELGNIKHLDPILFFIGTLLIITLDYFQVPACVLIGMLCITLLNELINHTPWDAFIALPPSISPSFFKMQFSELLDLHALKQVFAFFLIALFDATGTFVGLLNLSIFKNRKNISHTIERGLIADSIATTLASIFGTSSTSPFIESAAGIESGGRTGLTALVVACLFLISLFLFPITRHIPTPAVGAALIYVACCMMRGITDIKTDDFTEFAPAIITLIMIPFTFSIADGIGLGLLFYTFLKLFTKQFHCLNPMLVILSIIFLGYFFLI